ncbi:hypothetical protein EVG20_g10265 [Dentipellis fragilis]|uniref:Uncharacterized protein n=1 Tax=Dentipellis fragilis TaxID=205917 RepID=A0A4Y9XTK2_9AGAM|nr:hypothetical protein EVG20_g10265 [Dentipellis fragilis]
MTTGQASYQQHASGLAPPADYPSLSSSGTYMQPPYTRAMGPPPVPTQRPMTGRPRSRSVQQGSIPLAAHPAAPSPRSRRIPHVVPPTAADLPSYTQAPSTTATHQVGSSSTAHAPTYPVDPTSSDSRGSSNSQVQQPPAGPSRTRKGKEPLSDLFTREPLQFKRPADNSRPSSFIESDDEGKNGKLKKGWRYSARDSLSIRTSAKKMKRAVATTENTKLTDAELIAKGEALHLILWCGANTDFRIPGADMLASPCDIPEVKRRIKDFEREAQIAKNELGALSDLYARAQQRLSKCR